MKLFSKNINKINNNLLTLPEIEVKENFTIRFVRNAVSMIFVVLLLVFLIASVIIFTVNVELTIDANGVLEPSDITYIHTIESGFIKNIFVESGDTIEVNQSLAVLDSVDLKRNLLEIHSEIASIENKNQFEFANINFRKQQSKYLLNKAETQLMRAKADFRNKIANFIKNANVDSIYKNYQIGSHIALDYAMSEILTAKGDIKLRNLELEMNALKEYDIKALRIKLSNLYTKQDIIEEKIQNTVIKSPVNGIILNEDINKLNNKYIAKGELLFEIGSINSWDVVLFVRENDIHQVLKGAHVKIELKALQSTEGFELYDARVVSTAAEQVSDNKIYSNFSGLYRVTAKLHNEDINRLNLSKLKFGYSVKGKIVTKSGKIYRLLLRYFNDFF